ncbi:MAG: hypothetical protein IMF12_02410 [Proteobacteria bacterium]|nr:hypothetical protein [Pseudomonadota bacterium]
MGRAALCGSAFSIKLIIILVIKSSKMMKLPIKLYYIFIFLFITTNVYAHNFNKLQYAASLGVIISGIIFVSFLFIFFVKRKGNYLIFLFSNLFFMIFFWVFIAMILSDMRVESSAILTMIFLGWLIFFVHRISPFFDVKITKDSDCLDIYKQNKK